MNWKSLILGELAWNDLNYTEIPPRPCRGLSGVHIMCTDDGWMDGYTEIQTVTALMKRVKTRSVKMPPTVSGTKVNIYSTDGT